MLEFENQFKQLNTAQKEAVEAINGPVLVIAGPGTGKTQLLSMRVANIMRKSDVDASNILCLTFTNKASVNMRDRLLTLVGPESNKVTVKTFHGFAAELMSSYPDYFWNGAKLTTAPDALQLEIVQTILSKLPLSNPLSIRFAGKFTATDDVIKALRLAKEAGLTPEKLKAIIAINIAYIDTIEPQLIEVLSPILSVKKLDALREAIQQLPEQGIDAQVAPLLSMTTVIRESLDAAISADDGTGKTKHVGKWKAKWIQTQAGQKGMFDERRRNAWWLAFSDVYEAYRSQLHERGYYDYSDMLLEVITQLEQHPDLIAGVQERFQYVLIDEFQDSNAAQLRLAHLVADHHTAEGSPNLMAVGDDDQSIFGFNGAELNNMLFFDRNYESTKRIVLTDNYRSSQAILDTAEQIIVQAEDRLVKRVPGLAKQLKAKNAPDVTGHIVHNAYPTREQQLSEVARQIKEQREKSTQSIAVLARGHESLRFLASILINLGVPVSYEQQSNILDHELIKQMVLLSEIVGAIGDGNTGVANQKIALLVRHPAWGLEATELWELATANFAKPDWLTSLRESNHLGQKQLGDWLFWLSTQVNFQPLPVTFEQFLGLSAGQHMTSPIREYYLAKDEVTNDYLHSLSAIRMLQELVSEFSDGDSATLQDFVQFVTINNENGRGITDESSFVSGEHAVELFSVHKAKGLEFDQVYIIDAIEDNWKPRVAGRKPPANLPLQPPGEQDDDYIRLLYVAATRAKHTLIVTSYLHDGNGKDLLPTPFIRSAIPETIIETELAVPLITVLEENIRWPRLSVANEKANLASRLGNYRLSATHFLNFLDVSSGGPQHFFERHILRLPEAKTPQQGYGSAMHSAMQLAQKLTNQHAFDIGQITAWYQRSLLQEHLIAADYEKYLLHGTETLQKLFGEMGYKLNSGGKAELFMNDIRVGDALLNGVIDRLDITESNAIISDYKTGMPLSSFVTRDQTKAIKAWRHRSQLIFYAVLLRNNPSYGIIRGVDCQMIYLEAETEKELIRTYNPSSEEIQRMERLIQVVWGKILALDMSDDSGYSQDITGIINFEDTLLK